MKRIILLIMLYLICLGLVAQSPEAFNYQAVARDASGNVLANRNVSLRLSILKGTIAGTSVYSETHSGKPTNAFGLVTLEIGKGTPVSGSFSSVAWHSDSYFLKVEMDPAGGSSYQTIGTSQLLSVPYALHAKTVEQEDDGDATNEIQQLSISGTQLSLNPGGGTVTLPSSGGGDNWGTQTVVTNATLEGKGITSAPLMIARQSAATGQILKWDGTVWKPGDDISGSSLWTKSGSNIYFDTGKVGIGKDPGTDLRQFQVLGGSNIAIAAENATASYAALYVKNSTGGGLAAQFDNASGPVARFGRNIVISDGTQGNGKVLTSDANGLTSWQTPLYSKWQVSGSDIYYSAGKVGIGGANVSSASFQVKTTGSEIARFESTAPSNWIGLYTSGVRKGIFWVNSNTVTIRSDEGAVNIKTGGNNERLTIEDDGDITTPLTGTNKNIVPVAYGYVNQLGQLNAAKSTSNVTATVTGSAGSYNYIVTISGVTANSFIALVTPGGDYISFPRLMYESNTFTVNFMSHTGSTGQANNFSFVVFAP